MDFYKVTKWGKKHNTTIMCVFASVGVVVTSVLSARAARKVDKWETDTMGKVKLYTPAVISGGLTIACILTANRLDKKQQASLVSAYVLLDKSFKKYKEKVLEHGGSTINLAIEDEAVKDKFMTYPDDQFVRASVEDVLFYEPISDRFFWRTQKEVLEAEYHFNRNFILRGYATLNELYEFLGLEKTDTGEILGWSQWVGLESYGYQWVDFDHVYNESVDEVYDVPSYYAIHTPFSPTADYLDEI